jgi:hypothetical protein
MNADGYHFLQRLANSAPTAFERRFAKTSTRLGLGSSLRADELNLLYEAAFYATLCNIAFNGLGGCGGEIRPERESTRMKLERDFMAARDRFFECAGWKVLRKTVQVSVQRVFLSVFILEENLAE